MQALRTRALPRFETHIRNAGYLQRCGYENPVQYLGHFSAGFTLDTYTHITNDMQRGAAEKIGGFMESAIATTTLESPNPPEQSLCKGIPFEKAG